MSQNKNGGDSRGTLYRVISGEMTFSYDNVYVLQQGEGKVYIYTYLQDKCAQFSVHITENLGLVSPGWIISSHITLASLLYFHGSML